MRTSLFAVMVNWNLKEDTIACIHSLFATGVPRGQVIVVDSASEDGSVEKLKATFGDAVQLIACKENVGFVGGINRGTAHALQQGAEWVFILNNDTIVEPAFIPALEEFSQNHASYTLLGPLIYYQDVPDRIWYFADHRWFGSLLTTNRYKNRRDDGRLPAWERADYITGCAMLVRREVFEQIGFLDPAMFMYGEDVDFCWRAGQA
ncbi:MAG TPA: glycosyltransferase family 2 protein, partial [Anaerolineales bacterium]|nr:glycosyltransferase family 2 protein [Anaerolineales bacterium]